MKTVEKMYFPINKFPAYFPINEEHSYLKEDHRQRNQ